MYWDGRWRDNGSEKRRNIINPSNGEIIAVVPEGGLEEVDLAVQSARNAFEDTARWAGLSATERASYLIQVADLIEERAEEIARLESLNTGRLFRETKEDDPYAAAYTFRYYAGLINSMVGQTGNNSDELLGMSIREPLGVCAVIAPWNYPLGTMCAGVAPALAAGNTVVVKPASITPLTTILLFEIFEQVGIPAGTVNLILGPGSEIGDAIAADERVKKVVFTGGTDTGKRIMKQASSNLKKLLLELGGKSAAILFDDADLDKALQTILFGIFFSQGQICVSGSRLLVQESIYEKVVKTLCERVKKFRIGMPFDEDAEIGPVVSKSHMNVILDYIAKGVSEGATIAVGGKRITEGEFEQGYFIEPTIFINCTNEMTIVQEEIFGPVLTIQSFSTEEEAISMANCTKYGLAGMVFTSDLGKALRVCKKVDSGILWVNTYMENDLAISTTPHKESGMGVIGGIKGLEEFTSLKQVNIRLTPSGNDWFSDTE